METASFCGGVRHKRYSGQLEIAPENFNIETLHKRCTFAKNKNSLLLDF
jgi:hypothetical protein